MSDSAVCQEESSMSAVVILVLLGAATGFALGTSFRLGAIVMFSIALALFSAAVLHSVGFSALAGIVITATCLTISQMAYLIGVASRGSWGSNSHDHHDEIAEVTGWPKLH
jgi:hypothetical protein